MAEDPANTSGDQVIAPDGSIRVDLDWVEWSNSHWVRSPRVTEIATGRLLLDLWGTDWDADVSFPRDRTVRLGFRRYHVGGALDAEIDLAEGRYTIDEGLGGTRDGPLIELAAALEAASHRVAAAMPPRMVIPPPRATARSYAVALLILVGALIAIAAATFIVEHLKPRPLQHLDQVPPMPREFHNQRLTTPLSSFPRRRESSSFGDSLRGLEGSMDSRLRGNDEEKDWLRASRTASRPR